MDITTSDTRAVEFTLSRNGDSPVLQDLLEQILVGENISTVTAGGAYDTGVCHAATLAPDAVPIISIRKKVDRGRMTTQQELPVPKLCEPPSTMAEPSGYDGQDTTPAAASRLTCAASGPSERIAARDPDRQTAEIRITIALMNRLNTFSTAEMVCVAWSQWGKGQSCCNTLLCNNTKTPSPGLHAHLDANAPRRAKLQIQIFRYPQFGTILDLQFSR